MKADDVQKTRQLASKLMRRAAALRLFDKQLYQDILELEKGVVALCDFAEASGQLES